MTTSSINTINASRRIEVIDALRGFALMGICLVHCMEYFSLYWVKPDPTALHKLVFFLFAAKSYAIFALMFGLSFFIIMDSQARKGVDFTYRFAWRLIILLVFGCIHTMFFISDILQILGIIGLSLLFVYRLNTRWLAFVATLLVLQLPLFYKFYTAINHFDGANDPLTFAAKYAKAQEVFVNGSLIDIMKFNAWEGTQAKWTLMKESGRGFLLAGLFMWGLILGRIGFFTHLEKFARARIIGLGIALVASAAFYGINKYLYHLPSEAFQSAGMAKWYLMKIVDTYLCMAMMTATILLFIQFYLWQPTGRILHLLAPCGKVSLSVYLAQSLICIPLFYPFGLGWYETIGQTNSLLLGIAVYTLLVIWAHWWTKHFYYGPVEWVWRCATYMTIDVPFKKRQMVPALN